MMHHRALLTLGEGGRISVWNQENRLSACRTAGCRHRVCATRGQAAHQRVLLGLWDIFSRALKHAREREVVSVVRLLWRTKIKTAKTRKDKNKSQRFNAVYRVFFVFFLSCCLSVSSVGKFSDFFFFPWGC
ncbi:unnamed protein product, partial [Ectocarpus sp. 8 AP-2014]